MSNNTQMVEVPRFEFAVEAEPEMSLTLPYTITLRIRRLSDPHGKPCVFIWNQYDAFALAGFLLFRQTEHALEKIEVCKETPGALTLVQQSVAGGEIVTRQKMTANYQKALVDGGTYHLMWPGDEISMWDWGIETPDSGRELMTQSSQSSARTRLVLPRSNTIQFVARQESPPWPDRANAEAKRGFYMANLDELNWRMTQRSALSPPPLSSSDRIKGAPVLSVGLECSPRLKQGENLQVVMRVTYELSPHGDRASDRPITFHDYKFKELDASSYALYVRQNNRWTRFESNDAGGYQDVAHPPEPANVNEHEDFVTLRPGETWTSTRTLYSETDFNDFDGVAIGDVFRYKFKGSEVDWWDWGDKESHKDTVLHLPCWRYGPVVEPSDGESAYAKRHDNDGRPCLVVPASNDVEFCVDN